MLAALDALAGRLAAPEAVAAAKELHEKTSSFLIQWLTRHVLAADLKMRPYGGGIRYAL
jgi:hemerythrin